MKIANYNPKTLQQSELISSISDHFSTKEDVVGIFNRGSFARGCQDSVSDIDICFVVKHCNYNRFLQDLNTELLKVVNLVFDQGWVDTIVPDFGGIGFVYLAKYKEKLIQMDIYITTDKTCEKLLKLREKVSLFSSTKLGQVSADRDAVEYIKDTNEKFIKSHLDYGFQMFFECLLVLIIYTKQLYRSNIPLALKYRYMSIEAIARLLRSIHTPDKIDYLMYDWVNDFRENNDRLVKYFVRNIVYIDTLSEVQALSLVRLLKAITEEHIGVRSYVESVAELEEYIKNKIIV